MNLRSITLVFLLSISFIPFPTDLLGEYGELRFAVIFYAACLALARLLLALVWWYVFSGPIQTSDELDRGLANFHLLRSLAIPAIFLLSSTGRRSGARRSCEVSPTSRAPPTRP